jgi:hypothetical protein
MNLREIAKIVLEKRNQMSPIIMLGEMQRLLGAEGFMEALRRGWLIPEHSTGMMQVSNQLQRVEEMRAVLEDAGQNGHAIGDTVIIADEGQAYTAKVAAIQPDGSYVLAFGDKKPRHDKTYKPNEIQPVSQAQVNPSRPGEVRDVPVKADPRQPSVTPGSSAFVTRGPGLGS